MTWCLVRYIDLFTSSVNTLFPRSLNQHEGFFPPNIRLQISNCDKHTVKMWKAPKELTWGTKGSPGGFFFSSVFPVIADWSFSGQHAVIRTLSSTCFCPWRFFLFSPHLSKAFVLHSSITTLFNELASTACTPSTPHPYISLGVALLSSDMSSVLFVLLPPAVSHPSQALCQSASPSFPCDICHLFSVCSSLEMSHSASSSFNLWQWHDSSVTVSQLRIDKLLVHQRPTLKRWTLVIKAVCPLHFYPNALRSYSNKQLGET